MADAKVKLGVKIDTDEAMSMDRTKMAVLIGSQPMSDVEGQYTYQDLVQCPWCGNVGYSWLYAEEHDWSTCGTCGGAFND